MKSQEEFTFLNLHADLDYSTQIVSTDITSSFLQMSSYSVTFLELNLAFIIRGEILILLSMFIC